MTTLFSYAAFPLFWEQVQQHLWISTSSDSLTYNGQGIWKEYRIFVPKTVEFKNIYRYYDGLMVTDFKDEDTRYSKNDMVSKLDSSVVIPTCVKSMFGHFEKMDDKEISIFPKRRARGSCYISKVSSRPPSRQHDFKSGAQSVKYTHVQHACQQMSGLQFERYSRELTTD